MKKYMLIASMLFFAFSCIKDNSTRVYPDQNKNFSHIEIVTPLDTMSVDVGLPITIEPTITQTYEGEITYKWSYNPITEEGAYEEAVDFEDVTEPKITINFPAAESYRVRLVAENEWGMEIKDWIINVRDQDEGYYILSEDANGKANYSFARALSSSDIAEGIKQSFVVDVLAQVNPDIDIRDVVDVFKNGLSSSQILYIFTQTHIYLAEPTTFKIYNAIEFNSLVPGEKIVAISACDTFMGKFIEIYTDANRGYLFSKMEQVVDGYSTSDGLYMKDYDTVYPSFIRDQWSGSNPVLVTICVSDSDTNPLIWANCGDSRYAYAMYSNTGKIDPDSYQITYPTGYIDNVFDGCEIVNIEMMNGYSPAGHNYDLYVIARERANPMNIKIYGYQTKIKGKFAFDVQSEIIYTATQDISFMKDVPMFANGRYDYIFYGDGADGIYIWYPRSQSEGGKLPTTPSIKLGDGKVVTALNISVDYTKVFVGFYDENASGEYKGGMNVYDGDTLELLESYEGVADRPIEVGYKNVGQDTPWIQL